MPGLAALTPTIMIFRFLMKTSAYLGDLIGYLIKELSVHKKCVVWFGQLSSQKGEEPAHLGGSEVWVVHHHLGNQKDMLMIQANKIIVDN